MEGLYPYDQPKNFVVDETRPWSQGLTLFSWQAIVFSISLPVTQFQNGKGSGNDTNRLALPDNGT